MNNKYRFAVWYAACLLILASVAARWKSEVNEERIEKADLVDAPLVPPPITRTDPAIVQVYLNAGHKTMELAPGLNYSFWTFNGTTPGPFIRTRVGDTLEVMLSNTDDLGMAHNIDFHAVTGPGGGSMVLTTAPGGVAMARFKLLNPGLFIYPKFRS